MPFFSYRFRCPAPIQISSCRLRKIDYLCYAVHRNCMRSDHNQYKRLYLSALNLVNFLKTPYTTAPERVRVVFRCRRFTRTQSSRNSALPFLFCTNEPHLSALLPMQSNPMRRQDTFPVTGFFIQKESCVTFFPAAVLFLPAPAAPASGRKTILPPAT